MNDNKAIDVSRPQRTSGTHRRAGIIAFVGVASILWLFQHQRGPDFSKPLCGRPGKSVEPLEPEKFDWYNLKPSEDISWAKCYNGQKCARLSLPLDYFTPEGPKTEVALRMIPATSRENYKGTILINPGGPGGSGTGLVGRAGGNIAKIVGPEFDILGFDPRGTGATVPQAQCFDSQVQYKQWQREAETLLLNVTDDSIPLARSRERLVAERCLRTIGGNGKEELNGTAQEWGPGRFMSTPSVATDMLRITEKLGQEKLQYWGFSYGTILGQYFAAMYPEKVGRVIIDGVYDANDYREGLWDDNLVDLDKVVFAFYSYCHQAGAEKCPLYEATAEKVEERVQRIFKAVEVSPLPVPFATSGPALITRGILHRSFFSAAYRPVALYKILAEQLHAVEINNQTALQNAFEGLLSVKCDCAESVQPWDRLNEAFYPIAFGDSGPLPEQPGDFAKHLARLSAQSTLASSLWARLRLSGLEWKIEAKWRYKGPLSANTSHPILIAQPTFDPVCPISHARAVQKRYSGAGLLEQRSFGHCTLSVPSICSAKHIRTYFLNGTLPKEGTVCEPDELPFVGKVDSRAQSVDDRELLDALRELTDAIPHFGPL